MISLLKNIASMLQDVSRTRMIHHLIYFFSLVLVGLNEMHTVLDSRSQDSQTAAARNLDQALTICA